MAKKFYAVKKGLTPGIYTSWDQCKEQVNSYPGAEYKGFSTLTEAQSYLGISNNQPGEFCQDDNSTCASSLTEDKPHPAPGCAIAYVDGSYRESTGKFSYGIVLFSCDNKGNEKEIHMKKAFTNEELLEMRNVSGEIMGAAQAMKSAREAGLKEITIYHDYEGIAKWPLGLWKANKPWVIKYKAFYAEISQYIKVNFIKVKGHSNDKYNDMADELAKSALEE